MPALHPSMAGAAGSNHAVDWTIEDQQMAYVEPAKALAWMAADLLGDEACEARQLLDNFEPRMSKDEYLTYQRGLSRVDRWSETTSS